MGKNRQNPQNICGNGTISIDFQRESEEGETRRGSSAPA
jgi:hypothetical protein